MSFLWRGLQKSTLWCPEIAEHDVTYPVHMLDDTKTLRNIVVAWTLRFNDVLDADRLHASLSELLEIGDWKKLGGRLRLKKDGALEIAVPASFTRDRPAVSYTHDVSTMKIDEHELAKTLPTVSDAPSVQPGPEAFRAFAARPDAPQSFADFLKGDTPQLSLHVTSFEDATLVALSWPHTLMDVMGQQALLRAWTLVLAGRSSEVPPLLGARDDALRAVAQRNTEKAEPVRLASLRLKGFAMVHFGLRFAWDMIWNKSLETRTILLPEWTMRSLRNQAEADLDNSDGKQTFVSDGDLLTAWFVRLIASSMSSPRPITVLHALNARLRIQSLIEAPGIYIQNMAVAAFTFLSPDAATDTLGSIASQNRSFLMEQAPEGQVTAFLRELQRESASGSDPATYLCGDPNALLVPFTNWTRADLFNAIDLSPAIIRPGDKSPLRSNPPGTMIFHHAMSMQQSSSIGNVVVVMGKDHCGNYWLTATLLPVTWNLLNADLSKMQDEHSKSR